MFVEVSIISNVSISNQKPALIQFLYLQSINVWYIVNDYVIAIEVVLLTQTMQYLTVDN